MAQWSFPVPEVCSWNPVIGEIIMNVFALNCSNDNNKQKEAGNGPFNNASFTISIPAK